MADVQLMFVFSQGLVGAAADAAFPLGAAGANDAPDSGNNEGGDGVRACVESCLDDEGADRRACGLATPVRLRGVLGTKSARFCFVCDLEKVEQEFTNSHCRTDFSFCS